MRVMQSDLAILNAAQYDVEPQYRRDRAKARPLKAPPSVSNEPRPKKRLRPVLADEPAQPEPEEERKRARGRPRLDPTDQTPQDRRRTQIRLAQRAYRNRKESAISTLEKEVDDLKEVNEQMGEAYRKLFDYATRNGLLEQAPEFGQHLMNLEALARRSVEHVSKNEEEVDSSDSAAGVAVTRRNPSVSPSTLSAPPTHQRQQQQPQQPQQLWPGIVLSHEASAAPSQHVHPNVPNISIPHHTAHSGYEIIAQPTSQNASFPQPLAYDQPDIYSQNPWVSTPSPWNSLPNPHSYAFQEWTFGKRLQRTALQCAAKLITQENPPPNKMIRVFGLSRLFESHEQLRERTLACLGRTASEDLSHWRFPFQTVGGAGTHFPDMHSRAPELRTNGQGPASPKSGKPKDLAPFSTGPFDLRTNKLRETLIGLGGQLNLPGFDGVFWDPDEVDYYLLQNGVNIPALADHWVVEIEDGAFAGSSANAADLPQPRTHDMSSSGASSASSLGAQSAPSTAHTSSTTATSASISSPEIHGDNATMSATNPTREIWQSQSSVPVAQQFSHGYTEAATTSNMTSFGGSMTGAFSDASLLALAPSMAPQPEIGIPDTQFQGVHNTAQPLVPRKKTWRIDVEKFIHHLISKTTCLGRTPAVRPKDVDLAFWASIVDPNAF
ncbi:BZIP family transcription factor [Seiridium cupressi]